MSIFHASFQRSRSEMLTNICKIEKVVELTDEEYALFSQNLTASHRFLTQESEKFRVDEHGIAKCLLVIAEGRQDGILVLTNGADYAKHTAHLPNARKFIKLEQSYALSEFVDRIHSIVGDYANRAVAGQIEGQFRMPIPAFHDASENAAYIDGLFLEMLSERPEIANVEEDREIFITIAPEYVRSEDNSDLRELTQKDVDIMYAKHLLWLNEAGGEQADFSGCLLRDLNLGDRNFQNAVFDGAKFVNTSLFRADISFSTFNGARFYNCEFNRAKTENAEFKDTMFHSCEVTTTTFVECDFSRAIFAECYLGSMMYRCCIDGTRFGSIDNVKPDLRECCYDEETWAAEQNGSAITM